MKSKMISGLSFAALLAFAGSAVAADLPARMPVKAPPMMAPVWSWTGFYIGGNAGYAFSSDRDGELAGQPANVATVVDGARPSRFGLDREGFIGGVQAGYNWQAGMWVFGVEADIQYTDIEDSVNVVTTGTAFPGVRNNIFATEMEYLGTVRGRLGWTFDRTLIYATGGFAYGRVNNSVNLSGPIAGGAVLQFTGNSRDTETGYTVGGGIEHAFSPNWSVKAEYLYYDLGDTTVAANLVAGSGGTGTGYNVRFQNDGHIVRAGLNYRFGGGW